MADATRSEASATNGAPGRLAREVAAQQAALLTKLRAELGPEVDALAVAERLALDFGAITATVVQAAFSDDAPAAGGAGAGDPRGAQDAEHPSTVGGAPATGPAAQGQELASLYRPGQMRRRLDQLIETNRRYGHPFGLAVFDASGPATRNGGSDGGRETVLAILGAALRDSIRIVDEAFRLEEDAICVLAPNLHTVEGVQMAERLLGSLEELERAGGLRIAIAAGVVACPDHGGDADELLHKADAALWRARAVGQPVGVGALN